MSVSRAGDVHSDTGKSAAVVVYILFLLSLPSIGLLMFVGVIAAYVSRGKSAPWVRTHFDRAIHVFWTTFWWSIGLAVIAVLTLVFYLVGLGPLIHLALLGAALILAVWYHLVSLVGLLRLIQDKPA
jgi:uncharacterized membrane protein